MKTFYAGFFVAGMSMLFFNTMAIEQFRLKGVSLGMTATNACNNAQITNEFDLSIRALKDSVPGLVEMDVKECNAPISIFANSIPSKPARLLFQKDKLILYKLELEQIDLKEIVQILDALSLSYIM